MLMMNLSAPQAKQNHYFHTQNNNKVIMNSLAMAPFSPLTWLLGVQQEQNLLHRFSTGDWAQQSKFRNKAKAGLRKEMFDYKYVSNNTLLLLHCTHLMASFPGKPG